LQGYVTSNAAYDADSRVTQVAKGTTSSTTTTEQRTYTNNGLLLSRQEFQSPTVSNTITYTPDGFDRLGITSYQDGTKETFAYTTNTDNQDYVLTRAGQTITRTYDALNRVISKTGDPDVTYGYDYVGRLLQATAPIVSGDPSTGTWSIAYDTAGRRATDTGSDSKVIQYTYDGASNRTYVTYPDGKRIETLYDQLNRDYEIAYCTSSCGTTALDHLDALDRLTQRGFAAPAPGIYSNYSYAGTDTLISQIVHYFDPSGSATYAYTYNKARQVATESQAGTLVTIEGAAVASYTNDTSDRIATQNESSFSYDGNSDLTSDGTRTYTYDQEGDGRVLTATTSGLSASYRYDPYGRRYSKTVNGTTTVYVYDNLGKIASEYSGSGSVLRDYAYFSREAGPVSTWEASGNINYLQHDRLGTLVALSGGPPAGATLITNWYAQPDYGTTDLFTAGVTFGYAGYYFDQETGLYKTASRYYDPRLGRFLTPDPIRQQGGLNIYAYVQNDPLNLTDPLGLCDNPQGCGGSSYQLNQSGMVQVAQNEEGTQSESDINSELQKLDQELPGTTAPQVNSNGTITPGNPGFGGGPPASSFVGNSQNQLQAPAGTPPRSSSGSFQGTPFSGHAFDQPQNRGIPPSVAVQAIQSGIASPGNEPGTVKYYDPGNNISFIVNQNTGTVITVRPGP